MIGPEIRPLGSNAEREACVRLQEETWGRGFADRVPASILLVAQETGGIAAGAFEEGQMVGFVFGVTGIRNGVPVHWSDMLAVRASHRGRGIGYRLKLHQREQLLERGVNTMLWTFDPLEARNAHLNLNRLGAVVRTYRRDLYGDSKSPLHAGIGTDRLLAEWELAGERARARVGESTLAGTTAGTPGGAGAADWTNDWTLEEVAQAPLLNGWVPGPPYPGPSGEAAPPIGPVVRVAVPTAIQALKGSDPGRAREWRSAVRSAFEAALAEGFVAVGLMRGTEVCHYVLVRGFTL